MPQLGLGLSVAKARKPKSGSSIAPFGTPNMIAVTTSDANFNGSYQLDAAGIGYLAPSTNGGYNYAKDNLGTFYITSPLNQNTNGDYSLNEWVLAVGADSATIFSENASTDITNVPTTGWSPSITIKAGVYAADSVNINFAFAGLTDQISKFSNTLWANSYDEGYFTLTWNSIIANQWVLDCDGSGTLPATRATSTDGGTSTFIPSTGWSYISGSGQPITLSPFFL